jgi:hypothetical protein
MYLTPAPGSRPAPDGQVYFAADLGVHDPGTREVHARYTALGYTSGTRPAQPNFFLPGLDAGVRHDPQAGADDAWPRYQLTVTAADGCRSQGRT